jgi:hypothetical protein
MTSENHVKKSRRGHNITIYVDIQKFAYQRVCTRSDRTKRDFLAKIQIFVEAFCRILELAVVEVFHDGVLHLLLHVQELPHIKIIMKTNVFKVKEDSPRKQRYLMLKMLLPIVS